MKGICLCGGLGKRLRPLTEHTNKHLLPILSRRIVEHSLLAISSSGITDVILVVGGKRFGYFLEIIKNGDDVNIDKIHYAYQDNPLGGCADAMQVAERFVEKDEACLVIPGDVFFEDTLAPYVDHWRANEFGASVLVKETENTGMFSIVGKDNDNRVLWAEEKPKALTSNLVSIGFIFDYKVWDYLKEIRVSERGELELSDLIEQYVRDSSWVNAFEYNGYWRDTGTFDGLNEVRMKIRQSEM